MDTYLISNIGLWIAVLIELVFILLLSRTLVAFINKFQKSIPSNNEQAKVKVGDHLPIFKGKDQQNNVIDSLQMPSVITKLLFLSDTCGTCIETQKYLEDLTSFEDLLVIKSGSDKDVRTDDKQYNYKIVRSSTIMENFGIERVPTIITLDANGIVQKIGEIPDINTLESFFRV
ncbi:hypothetical protein D3C76_20010 [compost metagenome]